MTDKPLFVQFIHPGGEHQPDQNDNKGWNTGLHRRKFLRSPGRCVKNNGVYEGDLVFWGEWEPQSRVVSHYEPQIAGAPSFLFEPYYQISSSSQGIRFQNTDPFVFGAQFHYTGCLQHTRRGPTQLRNLDRGSIVLFGSCVDLQRFVLDTVFVVDYWADHNAGDYLQKLNGKISETYLEVTILPWYNGGIAKGQSHRLYFGATPEKRVDGMFSFFPCLPFDETRSGFARPCISMDDRITQNLTQGKRMSAISDRTQALRLWTEVRAQVEGIGLALGTFARLPEKRTIG